MKKIIFIFLMALILPNLSRAQQKLWTLLNNGGVVNSTGNGTYGALIVYDPVASTWTYKHNFTAAEGISPAGSPLVASDGNLYGTCNDKGGNGFGSIWKYDIVNSTFTVLHHFTSTTGRYSHSNLLQASNGKIYGVTEQNGANNKGTLFELNITTNVVTKLFDFSATDGYQAFAKLIEATPGKLLGVTLNGGANNNGVLFEYNYNTNAYTKKVDFSAATTGSVAWGAIIKAPNGKYYGMTSAGGSNSLGVIYEYDYLTNAYTAKQHLTATTGSNPKGALTLGEDGMMYGLTEFNGTGNKGTLIQYDYVNNILTKKVDFTGTANGMQPNGSLVGNSGKLYGLTQFGGTGQGTIFEYDYATSTFNKKADFSNGIFDYKFPFMSSFDVENCPAVAINNHPSNVTVCTSGTQTFSVTATGTGLTYQWQTKTGGGGYSNLSDNSIYSGVTTSTLSVNATSGLNGYFYRCIVASSGCSSYSNSAMITVNSNPSLTPSVAINVTSGNSTMCSGNSITFKATPTNGGSPSYQWKIGSANTGTNSDTYTSTTLTNGDIITCIMTSTEVCASTLNSTSNGITMNVTTTLAPSVAVNVTSGSSTMCAGSSITFKANPTNGGTPSYQWKIGSTPVGTNSDVFSSSTLTNGNVVTCTMTSDLTCVTSANATSTGITMNVTTPVTPSVSIAVNSGNATMCSGSSISLKATPVNGGTPSYQWKVNGSNAGANNSVFTSTSMSDGDIVTCEMTSGLSCVTSATATSNSISMNVTTAFTVTALSNGSATSIVCQNSNLDLTTNLISGATYSWTGPNGFSSSVQNNSILSITPSNSGNYDVIVTSGACTATSSTLALVPTTPTITDNLLTSTLTSSCPSGNQWYLDGAILMGETNQTILLTTAGSYTVKVTDGPCTHESLPYVYIITDVSYKILSENISVYPNPSNGNFRVSLIGHPSSKVELKDMYGSTVYTGSLTDSSSEINLNDLSNGIYILYIRDGKEEGVVKIIID